ncbi:efflux RND transporter periplasmic adaptor subunit [Acetivibrio clariflavus]|uniref:Multidrug resistance efflux pump n=1 Tax=Acetivibrio clariflavus (strain DSM 19732 / NBRC 101661 / EBR45) TaxID=720554 RepID=G8M1P0_ACECE|nr:HlyD family efflux transporter periplasmic adaptor subunit [Acetivibrio clariflavus]AEV70269.1 multidrug resistance efflux pump [Acetivibrio clariflavus DSM 19732]
MKKGIIILIIVVFVIGGLAVAVATFGENFESVFAFNQGIIYPVKAHKIEKGSISTKVSATGFIEEIEKSEVYIETPLKVSKLLVDVNDKVTKGQKLMELDMDELISQLEKLKIDRNVQKLSLDSPVTEAEIKKAESAVNAAENTLADAEKKLAENKLLYEASAITKSELEASEKAVDDAKRALDNAKLTYESAVSSKNMDRRVKEESLKAIELSIKELEKKIEKLNNSVLSPIDGVIVEVNVQQGSFTNSAMPAFKISNTDELRIKAKVNEYNVRGVQIGQKVVITGEGIDKDANVLGKVESISPVAKTNITSGGEEIAVEVLISIEESEVPLKPGLSVTCDIYTNEKDNILLAPLNIYKEDKDGNMFAYVISEDNIAVEKKIKFGLVSDVMGEVLEGLNEGDLVILDPQPTHKDGIKVKILNDN